MDKNKISVITLGCSKNTVDSERLMNQLKLNNFDLIDDPNNADSVIINTCGFIDAAKEESVNTILSAIELKKLEIAFDAATKTVLTKFNLKIE